MNTPPLGPVPVRRCALKGRWVAGFHSRTVPSPPALAISLPPGQNATADTPPRALACRGAPTLRRLAGFHSRTVLSPPALASSLPPGLNATAYTPYRALVAWRGA